MTDDEGGVVSNSQTTLPHVWLPNIIERIACHMHPNDVACSVRLVNKATAALLRSPRYTVIRLSQPSDPQAFRLHWGEPSLARRFPLEQRRRLIALTAASGVVSNLEVAVAAAGCLPTREAWCAAAGAAQRDTLSYLRQQACSSGHGGGMNTDPVDITVRLIKSCAAAALNGHRGMCEWLLATGTPWSTNALYAAARGGHADLAVQLLEGHIMPVLATTAEQVLSSFARGCHLDDLQQCLDRTGLATDSGSPWRLPHDAKGRVLAAAAGSPTPDWRAKVEWLEAADLWEAGFEDSQYRDRPCLLSRPWPADAKERIMWLHGRGYCIGREVVQMAAGNGDVAALRYLLSEGAGANICAALDAARAGHLEVLIELHAAGAPINQHAIYVAAAAGHLHVVAWLVETPRLLLGDVLSCTDQSGNVELIAWLRVRGARWGHDTFRRACRAGSEEALEWLVAEGCPMPSDGGPYVVAARNGDLATLACLRRLGCRWGAPGAVFNDCVGSSANPKGCPLPVLRWLLEAGCPVDWPGVLKAVERRDAAGRGCVREWLLAQAVQQKRRRRGCCVWGQVWGYLLRLVTGGAAR